MTKEVANNIVINELTRGSKGWDLSKIDKNLLNDFSLILQRQIEEHSTPGLIKSLTKMEKLSFDKWLRKTNIDIGKCNIFVNGVWIDDEIESVLDIYEELKPH